MNQPGQLEYEPVRCLHAAVLGDACGDRTDPREHGARQQIALAVNRAVRDAALHHDAWWVEAHGDAELIRFSRLEDPAAVIAKLTLGLGEELARINRELAPDIRVRLRLAFHIGFSQQAPLGLAGDAPAVAMRLLRSPQLQCCVEGIGDLPLAVITSDTVYEEIIGHRGHGLDPEAWAPIRVTIPARRFERAAWLTVPGLDATLATGLATAVATERPADPDGGDGWPLANTPAEPPARSAPPAQPEQVTHVTQPARPAQAKQAKRPKQPRQPKQSKQSKETVPPSRRAS